MGAKGESAMPSTLFRNSALLDTKAGEIVGECDVLIEGGRIKEVSTPE